MFSYPLLPPSPPVVSTDKDTPSPRKRSRTTPQQLAVLEASFSKNSSPSIRVREQLSTQLGISERSIQIWFQNRRAKVKNQAKKTRESHDILYLQQQYPATAASIVYQTAALEQNQASIDPNLYSYYYSYYFQQQQRETSAPLANPTWSYSSPVLKTFSNIPSSSNIAAYQHRDYRADRIRAHSVGPYPCYYEKVAITERHASLDPPSSNNLLSAVQTHQPLISSNPVLFNPYKIYEQTHLSPGIIT